MYVTHKIHRAVRIFATKLNNVDFSLSMSIIIVSFSHRATTKITILHPLLDIPTKSYMVNIIIHIHICHILPTDPFDKCMLNIKQIFPTEKTTTKTTVTPTKVTESGIDRLSLCKVLEIISFIQYYKKASFLSFSEGCKNNFDHCEYCIGCTNGICSKSYMNDLLVEITSSSQIQFLI